MKWCEVFQVACDDVDKMVDGEAMQYCVGLTCDDCEAMIEFEQEAHK